MLTGRSDLIVALGTRAIELFVMIGARGDLETIGGLLRSRRVVADDLDAVARFGNPEAWAYIAHFLDDAELGEAADRALRTLFGDIEGPGPQPLHTWEAFIATLDLDAAVRIRRGRPWSASTLVEECRRADVSAQGIAQRIDELQARAPAAFGAGFPVALWALEPGASQQLSEWASVANRIKKVEDTWATSTL